MVCIRKHTFDLNNLSHTYVWICPRVKFQCGKLDILVDIACVLESIIGVYELRPVLIHFLWAMPRAIDSTTKHCVKFGSAVLASYAGMATPRVILALCNYIRLLLQRWLFERTNVVHRCTPCIRIFSMPFRYIVSRLILSRC